MSYIPMGKGLFPRVQLNAYSDTGATAKDAFHRAAGTFLKKLAAEIGLSPADYSVRSNKGGIAVAGEVTLHSDDIYIQAMDTCIGAPGVRLLFRTCTSRKDCCGHSNNYMDMARLQDEDEQHRFIKLLKRHIELERERKEREAVPA